MNKKLFSPSLYIKTIKRFWPLYVIPSILGIFVSYVYAMSFITMSPAWNVDKTGNTTLLLYSGCEMMPFLMFLYAPVCAASVFGYLFKHQSIQFMHSAPVTRKSLFVTMVLSGLSIMAIPFVITGTILGIMCIIMGCFAFKSFVITIAIVIGEAVLFFAISTLVAMLAANLVSFAGIYFVINYLACMLEWAVTALLSGLILGIDSENQGKLDALSPIVYLIKRCEIESVRMDGVYSFINFTGKECIAVYFVVGIVILAISMFIYTKLQSENAGKTVSFGVLKPVFVAICTFASASVGTLILYSLFVGDSGRVYNSVTGLLICMLVASFLGYIISKMIVERKTSIFNFKLFVIYTEIAVVCILFCVAMGNDLFGIAGYFPQNDKLDRMYLEINDSSMELIPGVDDAYISDARELLSRINADKNIIKKINFSSEYVNGNANLVRVTFVYYLKNGACKQRTFRVPVSKEHEGEPDFCKSIFKFWNNGELQQRNLYRYDSCNVNYVSIYGNEISESYGEAVAEELFNAIKKDYAEGTARSEAVLVGCDDEAFLNLYIEIMFTDPNGQGYDATLYFNCQMNSNMKNSLEYLIENGYISKDLERYKCDENYEYIDYVDYIE